MPRTTLAHMMPMRGRAMTKLSLQPFEPRRRRRTRASTATRMAGHQLQLQPRPAAPIKQDPRPQQMQVSTRVCRPAYGCFALQLVPCV